jgi:DNA (cytosine-5)-methyltransferase 1
MKVTPRETSMPGTPRQKLRSLELFSGAGGLALGTHDAGFRHVAVLEWNPDACQTLRANAAAKAVQGISRWSVRETDVRSVDFATSFPQVDLVAGGPPCQPFSIGGKHRGMEDGRDMIPQFIRAVREQAPRAFILENVRGLTRQSFRNYFQYALLQLTYPTVARKSDETWLRHLERLEDLHTKGRTHDLRYNVVHRVLNAANYGVPQTRERVFVVGFRADCATTWHFPEATHSLNALLHDQWVSGDYWERHRQRRPSAVPSTVVARIRHLEKQPPALKPWATIRDAIHDLPAPLPNREARGVLNHVLQPGARAYIGHTGSPIDSPSKTLKAGDHGVPGGENMMLLPNGSVRYLTIREAARVQTFPDTWRLEGAWTEAMRQIGNAVPVRLAATVAKSVATTLQGS